jgi:hypothetical protein
VERIYLAQDREELVAGCYEYSEQPFGSIKCWVLLGRRGSSMFSRTTVPWS